MSNSNDELKTIRGESQRLIGQAIVASLLKNKEFTIGDYHNFFDTADYNQQGGNYTQTGGGNYTQNGGGNYTQSKEFNPFFNVDYSELVSVAQKAREI